MNNYAFKTQAHIHSLKGEMDEITVLEKVGENDYIITDIAGRAALFTRYYDPESGFTVFEEIPLVNVLEPIVNIRRVVVLMALMV